VPGCPRHLWRVHAPQLALTIVLMQRPTIVASNGTTVTCSTTPATPSEETNNSAVFLVRSLRPAKLKAFAKYNIVAYRDYIFQEPPWTKLTPPRQS
jgi:hypothetical protein